MTCAHGSRARLERQAISQTALYVPLRYVAKNELYEISLIVCLACGRLRRATSDLSNTPPVPLKVAVSCDCALYIDDQCSTPGPQICIPLLVYVTSSP
ncbi:hypothetical protein VTO73DRAFT_8931 [Trametes versicolor]